MLLSLSQTLQRVSFQSNLDGKSGLGQWRHLWGSGHDANSYFMKVRVSLGEKTWIRPMMDFPCFPAELNLSTHSYPGEAERCLRPKKQGNRWTLRGGDLPCDRPHF